MGPLWPEMGPSCLIWALLIPRWPASEFNMGPGVGPTKTNFLLNLGLSNTPFSIAFHQSTELFKQSPYQGHGIPVLVIYRTFKQFCRLIKRYCKSVNSGLILRMEFLFLVEGNLGPLRPSPLPPHLGQILSSSTFLLSLLPLGIRHFTERPGKTGLAVPVGEVHVLSGMKLETTSIASCFKRTSLAI